MADASDGPSPDGSSKDVLGNETPKPTSSTESLPVTSEVIADQTDTTSAGTTDTSTSGTVAAVDTDNNKKINAEVAENQKKLDADAKRRQKNLLILGGAIIVAGAIGLSYLSCDKTQSPTTKTDSTATVLPDSTAYTNLFKTDSLKDSTKIGVSRTPFVEVYEPITRTKTDTVLTQVIPDTASNFNSLWDISTWALEKEGNVKPSNRDIANKVYEIQTANPQLSGRTPEWSYDAKGKKQSKGDGMIDMIYTTDSLQVPIVTNVADTIAWTHTVYGQNGPKVDTVEEPHAGYFNSTTKATPVDTTKNAPHGLTITASLDNTVNQVYALQGRYANENAETSYILAASDYAKGSKMSDTDILTLAAMSQHFANAAYNQAA
ncbi:hypothetical protein C4573_06765 [Candidatus Woesearchaeota archaeon]|nr:MAG: hypothetical protein C4573_06765 [Candidatus Woesearchaeota archaeon]